MKPRRPRKSAKPLLHRYNWTLEFARTVRHLHPAQQTALLDNMRAVRAQQTTAPLARRVIWVEDAHGRRRPYTSADDRED
jgi:hypothetical protein